MSCDGKIINPTNSVKYLGITLDENLKGESIAKSVVKKASGRLSFYIDKGISLTKELADPVHCTYSMPFWLLLLLMVLFTLCQVETWAASEAEQDYSSHIGREEFEKLGMLKVEDRIKQLKLNHVFKIDHDEAPEYLISHFRKFSNFHRYSTRGSSTNFILPKVKGQACNSFFFTGIKEWNLLPNHVKTSKIHVQFKKAVKSHFLSRF